MSTLTLLLPKIARSFLARPIQPLIVTQAFSKIAPLPAKAPVLRWQSRGRGVPDMFARSDPQWQRASLPTATPQLASAADSADRPKLVR
jgi:hypothetical protein